MRKAIKVLLACAVLGVLVSALSAQPPSVVVTKVKLAELDCQGCLKKIGKQVSQVPGVAGFSGDIPSATVFVTHQPGVNPSPRALWEAVVKADHVPTRLESPAGVFTAKPAQ